MGLVKRSGFKDQVASASCGASEWQTERGLLEQDKLVPIEGGLY